MDFKQEDDFWNATSGRSFAFDDEDADLINSEEDNDVFHSTLEISNTLPLQSIISSDNLKSVLDDVTLPKAVSPASQTTQMDEIIKKLCLGIDCSLENFKSQEDKLYLLDKAIDSYDGNVILKIVLFIVNSLKKNLVFRHLAIRPIALQQYCIYLAAMNKLDELHLLYMATGNLKNLSNLFYLSSKNTSTSNIYKKLTQFNIEHLESFDDDFEKGLFQDHKKILDYKLENKIPGDSTSPSTTFAYLCKTRLDKLSVEDTTLQHFLKLSKMTSFKSEWIMLNTIAAHQRWPMLNNVFETQKWFNIKGKNQSRKYNVGIETIIHGLHKHAAPRSILEDFLKQMDDSDKALYLGQRYACHSFVVDTLSVRRDRMGLMEYKQSIGNDADWVRVIDKILLTDKKWAN